MPFPNNLPQELTSFVGRRREIAEVNRLLSTAQLFTLTGAGGCGKTRLALRVASHALKEYRDGVWFVDLAPLADPSLVPQAVASALGVQEQPGRTLAETLTDYLKPKKLLLVLDNCEHLIEACASLVDILLRDCPNLRVLATSRQPLGVAGETIWRVPSLSLPDPSHLPALKELGQYDAVRLFARRAQLRGENFEVTASNAAPVAQLCHQLDGIPLAIELAAARMSVLSVEEIVERLDERFRLLASRNRASIPRHQTLEAMLDWSYNLLSEPEKSLLRALSAFAGGCTLEAVEAIWSWGGEIDEYETIELLAQLVDKSLVIREGWDEKSRYGLLETIRQYAWKKLRVSGEMAELRNRHLLWYLALAEEAEPELTRGQQEKWLVRLEEEHDNLRAALRWVKESGDAEMGLRLAGALWRFWLERSHSHEGQEQLVGMLSIGKMEETGEVAQAAKFRAARAKVLLGAGILSRDQGDYDMANSLVKESLALWQDLKNKGGIALSLGELGITAEYQGDHASARSFFVEGLALYREIRDKRGIALSLGNLGFLAQYFGDYISARPLHEESLALFREVDDKSGIANTLANLGFIAQHFGDYTSARSLFEESLTMRQERGNMWDIAECLDGLARIAGLQGMAERAARLWGAAEALTKAIGAPLMPNDPANYESNVSAVCAQLGEETFRVAWAQGRAMAIDEAIEFALQRTPKPEHITAAAPYPSNLTRREVDVLRLVAEGLTDAQVAERLNLSSQTVHAHLRSIYSKLGVTTRGAASRFAINHNL